MIAASTYLPSASSSTIAASSIHGTGAQNFSSAMRNGCTLVSGIAFGPDFASRRRASSLVKPPETAFCASIELAGVALVVGGELCVSVCSRSFAADFSPDAGSGSGAKSSICFAFISDPGLEFKSASGST